MAVMVHNRARRARMRSARFWTCVGLFAASLLFMLFQGGKLAFMLFFVTATLAVYLALGKYSGISRVSGNRVLLNMEGDRTIEAGTSLSVAFEVQIPGFWPIPYVVIRDRLVRMNGDAVTFETSGIPDWKRRVRAGYVTMPLARGFYHFEDTVCSTEDIFGLFEHAGRLQRSDAFLVRPKTVYVPNWQQHQRALKGRHFQAVTTQALRESTQINGVREYIYGDKISRIHWNATAKTGIWKSKEFERESLPKTVIMLDRCRDHYRSAAQFELAVSVAASLLDYGQRQNLAMGLLSVGEEAVYLEPGRHATHYRRMMHHLTGVEANGSRTVRQILQDRARYFFPGCFFVIVSPRADERMLQTLKWVQLRQMNPCLVAVAPGLDPQAAAEWERQLTARGIVSHLVEKLEQLPDALGGGRR
jgi:uncharacterized protein (DUF58 family)